MNHRFGYLKAATGSFITAIANPRANAEAMLQLTAQAKEAEADLLLFPELALTGYTCADLFFKHSLTEETEAALKWFLQENEKLGYDGLIVMGLPILQEGQLFNAAAVIRKGRILGAFPKNVLPNYGEFYEQRWFVPAAARLSDEVNLAGQEFAFTPNLIVKTPDGLNLAGEICEDIWGNLPPSSIHTLMGANVIVNPSASNEVATKGEYRRELIRMHSGSCQCAYVYASSGLGESTTDLVFSGHCLIAVNGSVAAESKEELGLTTALIDLQKIRHDRAQLNTAAQVMANNPALRQYRYVTVKTGALPDSKVMPAAVNPYPFVPSDAQVKAKRCREIMHLQARGLVQRMRKSGLKKLVVGISGGLDSTLALLIAADALSMLNLPSRNVIAITMPGFGTSDHTKNNALSLMELMQVEIKTIDITKACLLHFKDIGHDPESYDITYQNVQARERTQILMDLANRHGALVVGTGDLSEEALGWSTYNGDHMSMYAVNAGVPKTLVRYLVAAYGDLHPELKAVLQAICDTEISPELLPPSAGGAIQSTENTIGKYDLHDFFLYHFMRSGFTREKLAALAYIAFPKIPPEVIDKTLNTFMRRFFTQQFKRSCMPDGPKVGTVALSPRGDWRMPSDADCVF